MWVVCLGLVVAGCCDSHARTAVWAMWIVCLGLVVAWCPGVVLCLLWSKGWVLVTYLHDFCGLVDFIWRTFVDLRTDLDLKTWRTDLTYLYLMTQHLDDLLTYVDIIFSNLRTDLELTLMRIFLDEDLFWWLLLTWGLILVWWLILIYTWHDSDLLNWRLCVPWA